jgi:acyl-CoA hydrolase
VNDKVTAINSALEIDLSGQGVADSIGFRIYSGIGGQMDFIRARHCRREASRSSRCPPPLRAVPSAGSYRH